MSILVTKTSNGFSVKFPFELKDNFKIMFPSAKWDSENKVWTVGTRSEKRLNEWIEQVKDVAEEIDSAKKEAAEAQLALSDLEKIKLDMMNIRRNIERERKDKLDLLVSKDILNSMKSELEVAKSELDKAKAEKVAELKEAKALFSNIVDENKMMSAISAMIKVHGRTGSNYRDEFSDACTVLAEQLEKLESAGLYSYALAVLSEMKFNRPDRDNPNKINIVDVYKLTKI